MCPIQSQRLGRISVRVRKVGGDDANAYIGEITAVYSLGAVSISNVFLFILLRMKEQ